MAVNASHARHVFSSPVKPVVVPTNEHSLLVNQTVRAFCRGVWGNGDTLLFFLKEEARRGIKTPDLRIAKRLSKIEQKFRHFASVVLLL